ncbi:MAG: glycosyltransferase family 4 protein [Paeniclostridium sordellii]|nr:glycosyltransferase family 4 protein [Paeniclostridium sordellii]
MKKKKILMILNYFYPDVASTGQLMTELCEELQDEFDITVIAGFPNYTGNIPEQYKGKRIVREKYQNVNILRVRVPEFDKTNKASRIKYILSYFFNSILAIMKSGKQDIVYTISQPPILGGVLGVIGKTFKRAKFIYNIQDFNPEQIEAVGYSKSKFIIEAARSVDKLSCRLSNKVLVVGRDMQETLKKRFNNKKVPDSVVINNWTNEKEIYPLEKNHPKVRAFMEKYDLKDKFVFMYSGNIGLYYDLENIIKVIGEFKDNKNVVFAFVGEGAVKQQLVDYCNENNVQNVKFIPYQDKKDLIYSLNAADAHIVTNAKGIKGVSVPSKVYGVMATGKSIWAVLEEGSEARTLIEECNCGVTCAPEEYYEMKNMIEKLISMDSNELNSMGMNGRKHIEQGYTKQASTSKYKELLNNV